MAKKDLISGKLWETYSNNVIERMNHPSYFGEISQKEAEKKNRRLVVADWGAESCGDAVRLFWLVDTKEDRIIKARFKTFGCGTAIASSDVMAELCTGKTVDEALKITNLDVERALRDREDEAAIPPQKMHCSVMAYDVIKKAASLYKGVEMEDLEEEEIVCECARVSLKTVKDVIKINDLKTVEEITRYTKAGAFCGSCIRPGGHEKRKYYLEDILAEVRGEIDRESIRERADATDFKEMSPIAQYKAVEEIFEEKIKPILHRDGGDVEIMDIIKEGETSVVLIRYLGGCATCAAAGTGTLSMIQHALEEAIGRNIIVRMT
ncbi:MAG TPA: iron-sulfur cluster assembly scaffold protein NifU [Firmicutes bacterium]|nr:iron-sulfur cluster assembly scaffold protein NifU [Bacillota bacterium]